MFNNYAWTTYLKAGGNEVVEMFRRNLLEEYTSEYADRVKELHSAYCPSKEISNGIHELLSDLQIDTQEHVILEGCLPVVNMPEGKHYR